MASLRPPFHLLVQLTVHIDLQSQLAVAVGHCHYWKLRQPTKVARLCQPR